MAIRLFMLSWLAAAASAGCAPEGDFQYALVTSGEVGVLATHEGAPVPGVLVSISVPLDAEVSPGALLYRGLTDEAGAARGRFVHPTGVTALDVVLQRRGYRGPYDDEALRAAHGPFAPTSRTTWPAEHLADARFELEVQP